MQVKCGVTALPVCCSAADEVRERKGVDLAILLRDVDGRVVDVMVNGHEHLALTGIHQGIVLGEEGRGRRGRGESRGKKVKRGDEEREGENDGWYGERMGVGGMCECSGHLSRKIVWKFSCLEVVSVVRH